MADEATPAAGSNNASRNYRVFEEATIDLSSDTVLAQLKEHYKTDSLEVLVKIGSAVEGTPKKALGTIGEIKKLNGEFQIIAESAITTGEVETEEKVVSTVK